MFKITSSGTLTTLHVFNGTDGADPTFALIQGSDGNFYGTTPHLEGSGAVGEGTVFKITPAGVLTTLHVFDGNDGSGPFAALVQGNDGNFYGTTDQGGSTIASDPNHYGYGTAFRLSTSLSGVLLTITSLSPAPTEVGGPAFTLTVTGTNFTSNSTVTFGGTPVTVTSHTATQLTVTVPASALTTLGTKTVTVSDPNNGSASVAFTVALGWNVQDVAALADGTARILWTRSDGAMGLWSMDANDLQTTVGPTYGPYSDSHGHWTATDLSTSSDGTSEVLWKRSDGAIGIWTFGANNAMTTVGSVYGPYAGFTAALERVLWVRSDRAAGLWSFGSNDLESVIGPVYGPY